MWLTEWHCKSRKVMLDACDGSFLDFDALIFSMCKSLDIRGLGISCHIWERRQLTWVCVWYCAFASSVKWFVNLGQAHQSPYARVEVELIIHPPLPTPTSWGVGALQRVQVMNNCCFQAQKTGGGGDAPLLSYGFCFKVNSGRRNMKWILNYNNWNNKFGQAACTSTVWEIT